MIPLNSNKTGGCDNISSNCVIWQGPDLPCIDLCKGDTISDVIAKLCEELSELSRAPGGNNNTMMMARVDQKGLENSEGQAARSVNNQTDLTNLIIENIVQARKLNQSTFGSEDVLNTPVLLPDVLQYQDPNTASIVRALPLQKYGTLLGTRLVETINAVTTLQGQVGNHEGRIVSLENTEKRRKINPTEKQILTTCVGTPGRLTDLSTALTQVERAFCGLQSSTGPQADLAASIGYQGASMASSKRLNGPGTLSTYNGFMNSPSNLAQSFTNAWIVINDMRAAVQSLIADVIPTACKDIVYGVFVNAIGEPGNTASLNINFSSCTIPSTFYDCDRSQGSKITVTDSYGSSQIFYKQIHQLQHSVLGTQLAISSLNPASEFFETQVQYCFTNGQGTECANTIVKTVKSNNICPLLILGTPGLTSISWTVNAQYLSAEYSAEIQLLNAKGSVIVSQIKANPGSAWTGSFTNLLQGSSYIIQISYGLTQENIFDHVCPQQSFYTQGAGACVDNVVLHAAYKTIPTDLQYSTSGSFTTILCDNVLNPGVSMGDIYIAGYTTVDGTVSGVLKNNTIWSQSLTPCAIGKINANGVSIDYNNPAKSLLTNNKTTAPINTSTTLGDGWRYIDAITNTTGIPSYVYTEVDTNGTLNNLVPQVYFSCVGDEINISQQGWTTYCPKSTAETSFITNYNYQIAYGNAVSANSLIYTNTSASYGIVTYTPNILFNQTQQFNYSPLPSGQFTSTDSASTKLTIGAKNSGNYINSFTRGFYPEHMDTDIVVFIDTDSYTLAEGVAIKNAMTAVHSNINTRCGSYNGKLYILPVNNCGFDITKIPSGSASAYLSHHKIIALRGDGTTLTAGWETVQQIYTSSTSPTGWWNNLPSTLAKHVMIFSFTNQAFQESCPKYKSSGLYTTASASDAPNAPTNRFKADYDDSMNILVDNNRNTAGDAGTFKGPSTWAGLEEVILNTTYPILNNAIFRLDGHYVIAKETDASAGYHDGTDGTDKALIRQLILAINATNNATTAALVENEYNAYRFTANYLNVENITNWKDNLITNANPYNATVITDNVNNIAPLSDLNIQVVPYMDKYFPFAGNLNDPFTSELKKLTCIDQAADANVCPVVGTSSQMGGELVVYGVADILDNTSRGACASAGKTTTALYNSTGIQFDGLVRCYTTSQGAIDQDYRLELIHNRWYARSTGSVGQPVAQYSRTYPYWKNATIC